MIYGSFEPTAIHIPIESINKDNFGIAKQGFDLLRIGIGQLPSN